MRQIIISIIFLIIVPVEGFAQKVYTLEECERLALENNHKIKNANLEIQAASQTKKEAFTAYFPKVSATGIWFNADQGLLRTEINVPYEISSAMPVIPSTIPLSLLEDGRVGMVTATQPVFTGGRIIMGNRLAKIGEDVADIQLQLSRDEVILTTQTYYYTLVQLNEHLKTLSVVDSLLSNILNDVKIAVRAGLTNRNDLLRVELQKQEVESNRLKLTNNVQVVKLLLGQYIGMENADFEIYGSTLSEDHPPRLYYIDPSLAVQQRKEIKLLDHNVNASRLTAKIAGAERLPSVAVGAGYIHHDLMGKDNNTGLVYATLSIPISDWWGKSHARQKQKFKTLQVENDRQNAMELMIVEINQVWNEVVESYHQIKLAEKSIESSTENLRLNRNFYQAGTVSLNDVLDAQVIYQQSCNQLVEARSTYIIKLNKYKTITGQSSDIR